MPKPSPYERYSRQMRLKGFGEAGQQKLQHAKVLVVGAGGLGCPALQYLAAAGVGTIGIADDDTVALHNLHRQVLYTVEDIGLSKALCAKKRLLALNPDIHIIAFTERLDPKNALDIIGDFELVLDGTDNFATRYLINDACVLLHKILVYGAVSRFEGQVAVFNHPAGAANYRDLFPQPPADGEVPGCAETGVLGVLPGIIGAMQAAEAIKIITGLGRPLSNRLLSWNALSHTTYEVEIAPRPDTAALIPKDALTFAHTNYHWLCGVQDLQFTIDAEDFSRLLSTQEVDVIDVREPEELPVLTDIKHHKIPMARLFDHLSILKQPSVVLVCQSGVRSLQAAKQLHSIYGDEKEVYSLAGGVVRWFEYLIKVSSGKINS